MILPPDWIENSIETYIYQHTTKSQAIYWVVLATIVLAFILLPFVYVDISIQSNGVIRPAIEKTEIKETFFFAFVPLLLMKKLPIKTIG